jgi:hypothetical protein
MKSLSSDPRILALVIRASRLGFVVFAGPKQILDWGTHSIPRAGPSAERSSKRILALIRCFTPSAIAVKLARRKNDVDTRLAKKLLRFIVHEATLRSTLVVRINEKDIKRGFQMFKGKSKYDRARVLVSVFPELDWKMPRERKPWQTEPRAMMVFDATAIGFAYWQKHDTQSVTHVAQPAI